MSTVTIGDREFTALPQTNSLDRALRPLRRDQRTAARRRRHLLALVAAIDAERLDDVRALSNAAGVKEGQTVDEILDLADEAADEMTKAITGIVGASFRDADGNAPQVEWLDEHLDWRRFKEIAVALGWDDDDEDEVTADPPATSTTTA